MTGQIFKHIVFNNRAQMGGVCTTVEPEKDKIECPHKKVPKKEGKPLSIGQDITKD